MNISEPIENQAVFSKIAAYQSEFARYNRRRIALFRKYFKYYHRLEVIGAERVPQGPALLAANHGGGWDLDIVCLQDCVLERSANVLIAENWHFTNHAWGRYYVGGGIPLWTRGGIRWEFIDPYLQPGGAQFPSLVTIFPEGHSGLFWQRRVLHRFYPGVVRIALRYRVPIVPVAMVGFAAAAPILADMHHDHGPADPLLMLPALPLKLKVEFGEPFELSEFYGRQLSKADEWRAANEIVREHVAALLRKHVKVELEAVPAVDKQR